MAGSIVRLKLWNDSEHRVTEWALSTTKNHEWNSLLMNKQMLINEKSLEKVMVFIHYSLAPNVNPCDNVFIQMSQRENQKQIFLSLSQHKCPPPLHWYRNEKQQNSVLSRYCPTKLCLLCLWSKIVGKRKIQARAAKLGPSRSSVTEATITRLQNFNKDYDWTICIFLPNCFDVIDLIIVLDSLQTCFDCNLNNNL